MAVKSNTGVSKKKKADDQDVDTDDTLKNDQDDVDTDATNKDQDDADDDAADDTAKLPKNQAELDALVQKRLDRQKASLEKKHKADVKKLTEDKDKSEVELERQKSSSLLERITEKNFILAAREAGASLASAQKLYKLHKDDIEFDDDGEIVNLDDVMDTAQADFGELFNSSNGTGSGDGGAGGKGKKVGSDPVKEFNDQLKSDLGII